MTRSCREVLKMLGESSTSPHISTDLFPEYLNPVDQFRPKRKYLFKSAYFNLLESTLGSNYAYDSGKNLTIISAIMTEGDPCGQQRDVSPFIFLRNVSEAVLCEDLSPRRETYFQLQLVIDFFSSFSCRFLISPITRPQSMPFTF